MFLFKLAFLNIGRNPRRSVITVLAVGVGLAALIFLWGFADGTSNQMRENVISLLTGHLQVHSKGFESNLSVENTIMNREEVISVIKDNKSVATFAERVKCEALIGTSENSRGVLLVGVNPAQEKNITRFMNHIVEGEALVNGDDRSVLIGTRLAAKIGVELGDKVVVMTQAMDGTLAGYAYHIKGIFHTGSQTLDEVSAYITLESSQELLSLDKEVHEIAIKLKDTRDVASLSSYFKNKLSKEDYEVLQWNEIVPEVEQWVSWSEAIIKTILVTVMIVIGVSIMNTVLMSVFERTREFGVMMAIGTNPGQIIRLILLETAVLQFFGMILGLIAGYAVTGYFGKVGIAFPELEKAFSRSYMSTVTYTMVELPHVIQSIIALFLLTTLISLYPAWKAGRMEPIKAIYRSVS